MKKFLQSVFIASTVLLFSGCAHKIEMSPNLDTIRAIKTDPYPLTVAYYISETDKNMEITTPGGGGDKVKYTPYADTEGALNAVLSKIFNKVYSLKTLEDKTFIADKSIRYIFQPRIVTSSSSENLFTWPPEKFTIELTCQALDPANGNKLWAITTNSTGIADFGDYRKDFSFAARVASEKAFLQMTTELSQTKHIEYQEIK